MLVTSKQQPRQTQARNLIVLNPVPMLSPTATTFKSITMHLLRRIHYLSPISSPSN